MNKPAFDDFGANYDEAPHNHPAFKGFGFYGLGSLLLFHLYKLLRSLEISRSQDLRFPFGAQYMDAPRKP